MSRKDSCEKCGKVAELVFVGYDELCPKCANKKIISRERSIEAEMLREYNYEQQLQQENPDAYNELVMARSMA